MKHKVKSYWNERWKILETPTPTKRVDYFISDYGRIKSVAKSGGIERLLKGSRTKEGFHILKIRLAGKKRYSQAIHIFVAQHFVKNENEDATFVTFINGDKNNNYWKNLKWITREEQTELNNKVVAEILKTKGRTRTSMHKMTESKVILLRKRIKAGKTKRSILAKNFGISMTQLKRIERRENWKDI